MKPSLRDSKRYRDFVAHRDQALERIHQNAQIDLSRILYEALEQVERLTAALAVKAEGAHVTQTHVLFDRFQTGVADIFSKTFPILVDRIMSFRRAVYVLTYGSEQEAIGRATQKRPPIMGPAEFRTRIQASQARPSLMGPIDKRAWHSLMQLRQRLSTAFLAAIMGKEHKPQQILARVKAVFPPIGEYTRPPRALSKVREARYQAVGKSWFDFDFVAPDDWDLAVDAYTDTELPPNRFDNSTNVLTGEPATPAERRLGVAKYEWELEQEVTEDFVRNVRDGQVDAAKDLGIQEFVWVAILDQKTCEDCCAPRNGLTTSEIKALGDDCDATVPPAHFNCRCQISPVAAVDEVEGPDWQSFNEWLEAA